MDKRTDIYLSVLWAYDWQSGDFLTGGLERWARDLALLCNSHGLRVRLLQKDTRHRVSRLSDSITVQGIPCSPRMSGHVSFGRRLKLLDQYAIVPHIFVSQELSLFAGRPRAIAVNHGIFWNGDKPWFERVLNRILQRRMLETLSAIICVDTNYINWCHAEIPGRTLWREKLTYIPNYANEDECVAGEGSQDKNLPVLLFARRMGGPSVEEDGRGLGLFLKAVRILESRGHRFVLRIRGRGRLAEEIPAFVAREGIRSEYSVREVRLDQMVHEFQGASVSVVPSMEQEGTSLTAVESLVAGVSTVVSHIGGLPNIVVPGLNGEVCDLSPCSLADAIARALNRRPNQHQIEANRLALGKKRWDNAVWSVIDKALLSDSTRR